MSPPSDEAAAAASLQPDNVTPQVAELVAEDAGPDEGLQPLVAGPHLLVLPLPVVRSERFLDEDRGRPHLQEAPAAVQYSVGIEYS